MNPVIFLATLGCLGDRPMEPPAPMPEPILAETTTDIDGTEPGEMEMELNVGFLRAPSGPAYALQVGPEIEYLVTHRLGARIEASFSRGLEDGASRAGNELSVEAGLSWKLLHDFVHDFHLQAEVNGRLPAERAMTTVEPGESPLPVSFDLRSGIRRGRMTLRNSLGASAGRGAAHVPIRGSAAVLVSLGTSGRYGFGGIELEADGARQNPALLAVELVPSLIPLGLPFVAGLVFTYSVGAPTTVPVYGVLLRVFLESEREIEYGKPD